MVGSVDGEQRWRAECTSQLREMRDYSGCRGQTSTRKDGIEVTTWLLVMQLRICASALTLLVECSHHVSEWVPRQTLFLDATFHVTFLGESGGVASCGSRARKILYRHDRDERAIAHCHETTRSLLLAPAILTTVSSIITATYSNNLPFMPQ